ncbi:MAG: hypothetical protein PHO01_08980 [Desulfotomaculaceae bacterium]|nr:hypothetical protein [Desulfotomaculaceae bacterium]
MLAKAPGLRIYLMPFKPVPKVTFFSGVRFYRAREWQKPAWGSPGSKLRQTYRGPRLKTGMTLAIEPMICMGTYEVRTLVNKRTVVTLDTKLSGHFEYTIAITDDKPEIMTGVDGQF